MWASEGKSNPTKVVCGESTSKHIVACFFGKTGHVATVPLEQRCTELRKTNPPHAYTLFIWEVPDPLIYPR